MAGRVQIVVVLVAVLMGSTVLIPPPGYAAGTFTDDDGSIFEQDIEWMAAAGITKGCNPPANTRFCPDSTVTRGQMAAFLVRALNLTDDGGGNNFIDDNGHIFEQDIAKLAAAGITKGCNPPANTKFCPDGVVTRGTMAAFLVRALNLTDDGGGFQFVDDNGHIFEQDIAKLATAGITKGCNPPTNDRFCPDDKVTRAQMAAFLHRALSCALPGDECEALEVIYDTMGGPGWTDNTGWKTGANPCTWFGVTCKDGQVDALDLNNNNLTGSVPAEIADLTKLRRFHVTDNSIVGTVPAQLTTMTSLQEIRMSGNSLNGSMPAALGDLPGLTRLELSRNSLTGSIPANLGNLADLDVLSFSENGLTGSIPTTLGGLTKIRFLSLDGNNLNGAIPTELGDLSALKQLRLNDNDLAGAVPASFLALTNADVILLNGQSGCLTAAPQGLIDFLAGHDPIWNDGCPP